MTTATVTLPNHASPTWRNVNVAGDTTYAEAVQIAQRLKDAGFEPDVAWLDRNAGMIISAPGANGAWHFTNTLCGYPGNGVITTSQVLEIFGFGRNEDIFEQICHGGDGAHFTLFLE